MSAFEPHLATLIKGLQSRETLRNSGTLTVHSYPGEGSS
ncbi:hypothetical protein GFS31_00230 [Leptolyngbya sp. BL0902]|nr:hypothetical protein GFS31_00230 [Leptolyngbya sp. BL0902]